MFFIGVFGGRGRGKTARNKHAWERGIVVFEARLEKRSYGGGIRFGANKLDGKCFIAFVIFGS